MWLEVARYWLNSETRHEVQHRQIWQYYPNLTNLFLRLENKLP